MWYLPSGPATIGPFQVFRGSLALYRLFPVAGVNLNAKMPQEGPDQGLSQTHMLPEQTPFRLQSMADWQPAEASGGSSTASAMASIMVCIAPRNSNVPASHQAGPASENAPTNRAESEGFRQGHGCVAIYTRAKPQTDA